MRILVTGCAGFIGSRLCEWILKNQPTAKVYGFDDLSSGFQVNTPSAVLCDHYLEGTYDYVFHCAAFAAECLSPFVRRHCYTKNVVGTAALLNNILCTGTQRLVFLSSIAVYGRAVPPFNEHCARKPIDPYGLSKATSEDDIAIADEQFGLDWCTLRLFNVYGPGQSLWNKHRNVFGIWMRQKLEGKPLTMFGDGSQERAFTYIDDILPTIWQAATHPAASREVFNVGSPVPVSIAEALSECCQVIGESDVDWQPARHEASSAWCDVSKAYRVFGGVERTPMRDGLAAMWTWAMDAYERYPERRNQLGPAVELWPATVDQDPPLTTR